MSAVTFSSSSLQLSQLWLPPQPAVRHPHYPSTILEIIPRLGDLNLWAIDMPGQIEKPRTERLVPQEGVPIAHQAIEAT